MFATSKIPEDIIGVILRAAELSIDTRLAMKEYVKPRKVVVPDGLVNKLARIYSRRSKNYRKYVQSCNDSPFLWCVALDRSEVITISENTFVEFYVSEVEADDDDAMGERVIEFHQKITTFVTEDELTEGGGTSRDFPLFTIKDLRCDISTGKPVPIMFYGNTMYLPQ